MRRQESDTATSRHKQKQLDLTIPFRTSGLSPGAKLELITRSSSPTVVTVALKLPPGPDAALVPGGRLVDKFRSDTTLWKLLRAFESKDVGGGQRLNITARGVPQMSSAGAQSGSGQLYYEMPALNIMGRELSSVSDLQKTLSQVGIHQGSSLLQLSFKKTDKTLHDALQGIAQFFDEIEAAAPKNEAEATNTAPPEEGRTADDPAEPNAAAAAAARQTESQTQADGSSGAATAAAGPMDVDGTAPANPTGPVIYSAPTSSAPAAALIEEADSVYQPTIAHAQLHQERLKATAQNRRLLSDHELAAQAAARRAKMDAIEKVRIRVRFPDGMAAAWAFGPAATGADLFREVRAVMASADQPFKLGLPAGQGHIEDRADGAHTLIRGYELEGGVLVNLIWADAVPEAVRRQPFLRDAVRSQAREIPVPAVPQGDGAEEGEARAPQRAKPEESEGGGGEGSGGGGKKMPKWLKLGKK